MIITRAPFRLPLGGGGTDIPFFASVRGGALITATINQYIYISIHRRILDELIWLSYSTRETQTDVDAVQHALIREALKVVGIRKSIEIHSMTELSAQIGLGTSGAFLTALLQGLYACQGKTVSRHKLAQDATLIERILLKQDGGIQDQYIAAYGGFCAIENQSLTDVQVERLDLAPEVIQMLTRNLLLFYTGVSRSSAEIIAQQQRGNGQSVIIKHYDQIKEIGFQAKRALLSGDLEAFGKTFHEHWLLKRVFTESTINRRFDSIYGVAMKHGALGGKIIGAGGGGFFLFYAEDNHAELCNALRQCGMVRVPFEFDFEGTTTILNEETVAPVTLEAVLDAPQMMPPRRGFIS